MFNIIFSSVENWGFSGNVRSSQRSDLLAAGPTTGTEVPLQSAPAAFTLTLWSSLPPLPLPHISTFQHSDTVTARPDFHNVAHGQWADLPAAGRMPLRFPHCCSDKLGLLRDSGYRGIHAHREQSLCVILTSPNWDVRVCIMVCFTVNHVWHWMKVFVQS